MEIMDNTSEITALMTSAVLIFVSLGVVWLYRTYKSKKAEKEWYQYYFMVSHFVLFIFSIWILDQVTLFFKLFQYFMPSHFRILGICN